MLHMNYLTEWTPVPELCIYFPALVSVCACVLSVQPNSRGVLVARLRAPVTFTEPTFCLYHIKGLLKLQLPPTCDSWKPFKTRREHTAALNITSPWSLMSSITCSQGDSYIFSGEVAGATGAILAFRSTIIRTMETREEHTKMEGKDGVIRPF